MWEVSRGAVKLAATAIIGLAPVYMTTTAHAQSTTIQQNISGFNLPGVTLPQGHDEVRAADGTTCRSAVGGNGAYMDVGVIGNPEQSNGAESSVSAYGRLVVPLGANRKRVDCTRLYDLEVARLEMELKLMQMGMGRGMAPVSGSSAGSSIDGEAVNSIAGSQEDTQSVETPKNVASVDESVKASEKANGIKPQKQAEEVSDGDDWADDGWSTEGLKKKS